MFWTIQKYLETTIYSPQKEQHQWFDDGICNNMQYGYRHSIHESYHVNNLLEQKLQNQTSTKYQVPANTSNVRI